MTKRKRFSNLHHKINIKQHLAKVELTGLALLEPPTAISLCMNKLMRDAGSCAQSPFNLCIRNLRAFKKVKLPNIEVDTEFLESRFNGVLRLESTALQREIKSPSHKGAALFRHHQIQILVVTMLLLDIEPRYSYEAP